MDFYWFLPASDGRFPWSPNYSRRIDFEYLKQLAGAIELNGFNGALIATRPGGTDPWTLAAALAASTSKMKFIVAQYAGLMPPLWLAQMILSLDCLSQGRLVVNIITGSAATQPQFGINLDHSKRYELAEEYWGIVIRLLNGEAVTHEGKYVVLRDARLLARPADWDRPVLMMGGASDAGVGFASRYADIWLSLATIPSDFKRQVAEVQSKSNAIGRKMSFGIRAYVIVRDTDEEAWQVAQSQLDMMDWSLIEQNSLNASRSDSEGDTRLHKQLITCEKNDRVARHYEIYPGLWGGLGLIRQGTGTTIIGSADTVERIIREYASAGASTFILGGYPHIEEAFRFQELVLPRFVDDKTTTPANWAY